MNVKLTTTHGKEVLVNWDNVDYIRETTSHYSEVYTEVHFGKNNLDIRESVEQVGVILDSRNGVLGAA